MSWLPAGLWAASVAVEAASGQAAASRDFGRHRPPGPVAEGVHNLIEELLMMMQVLTDVELDAVSAGASSASLRIASTLALGPNNAMVDVADVDVFAETVGGLAPSNTAFVSGRFTATSD